MALMRSSIYSLFVPEKSCCCAEITEANVIAYATKQSADFIVAFLSLASDAMGKPWECSRNLARPERFELPTYCSGGCRNSSGHRKINDFSVLQSGVVRHCRLQLNTF